LCGPSGIGKTTLIDNLVKIPNVVRLPAYTDRPVRSYERNGREYFFVSPIEFAKLVTAGDISPEDIRRFGDYSFGFSHSLARRLIRTGKTLVVEAFCKEIAAWRAQYGEALLVVAMFPADKAILRQRLIERGHSSEFIEMRLQQAIREIGDLTNNSSVNLTLNINSDTTTDELVDILLQSGLRRGA
jgi:guanylate kinase